jgi:hypothetical protein
MLKYIGSQPLVIHNYGLIKTGDVITREDLCQSLASRQDFVEFKQNTNAGETPKTIEKSKRKKEQEK